METLADLSWLSRVRRDELYGSWSDAGSRSQDDAEEDAELRAKLNARLSSLLGLDLAPEEPASEQQVNQAGEQRVGPDEPEENHEEEFEFRLFSTSSNTNAPAKVVLAASDDEHADQGEGGFVAPSRPVTFYLAGQPTPEQLQEYRSSAVAGEDIVLGARKRAWGLERPWRVINITLPGKSSQAAPGKGKHSHDSEEGEKTDKRKRPGKKRRIATRIKIKAEKEKREAEQKNKLSKEEHLSEKKKRLNRERKLKRRAKEREKRLAGKGQDGTQPMSEAADSGSDDSSA